MNVSKKLQALADKSLEHYHDDKFAEECKSIILANKEKEKKFHKNRKMFSYLSATCASILIVVVSIFFFVPNNNESNVWYGGEENVIYNDVNVEELNVKVSKIYIDLDNSVYILSATDKYYNEVLYYRIYFLGEGGENLEIVIVINDKYNYPFEHEYNKTENINGFELKYSEKFNFEDDLYTCNAFGEIDTDREKIYLSFDSIEFEESSLFIDFLNQIIKKR